MSQILSLFNSDCLNGMKMLCENSIDAIVTDPPYGLSFMGKKWDYDVPSVDVWKECLRILKPGGHLLSFGGTRTYHRMTVAIEDAGFEIRDQLQWIYGSGFPKSMDVSKAIDKAAGVERTVVDTIPDRWTGKGNSLNFSTDRPQSEVKLMGPPVTTKAQEWSGWGTALKPANEPICLARKPIIGTVAQNILEHSTGAINIDATRIGDSRRWPTNVFLDEESAKLLDSTTGDLKSGGYPPEGNVRSKQHVYGKPNETGPQKFTSNSGGPSRFFYVAKASKSDKNAGIGNMPYVESGVKNDSGRGFSESDPHKKVLNQNFHPTVKPTELMKELVKLITPPNGTVLDPFMGSGSTGVAARELGFGFIGFEISAEYFNLAKNRIESPEHIHQPPLF